MKALKLLSFFAFMFFLISSVSAIAVYGDFSDSSQSMAVTVGDSVTLNADFISINPPMTVNAVVYDANGNTIETFASSLSISETSYFPTYTIDTTNYNSGFYEIVLSGSDSVNTDSHTLELTVRAVADSNAPVITLIGSNPVTVLLGSTYIDAGATATDVEDGDLTSQIVTVNPVDTSTLGSYLITYNVEDSSGNAAAQVTRTVTVESQPVDTNAPVITLLGDALVTITQDSTYTDAGATALDLEDGDLTSSIVTVNPVDTSTPGSYIITYNVQDAAGNAATEVSRMVTVTSNGGSGDTTAPILTVITPQASIYGSDEFTFEVTTDETSTVGYELDSNSNVSMTENLTNQFLSSLLTLVEGNHSVTFYATDAAGNTASETVDFSVDLGASTSFVLTVITPQAGEEYDDEKIIFRVTTNQVADVTFSINNEPNVSMDFVGVDNGILTFTYSDNLDDGDNTITFYATDAAANVYSETIEFNVDTSSSSKKKKSNEEEPSVEDKAYFKQFTQVNSPIHLSNGTDEETEDGFLNWFKNAFGFEFFYFLIGLFILLLLLALLVMKNRRQ